MGCGYMEIWGEGAVSSRFISVGEPQWAVIAAAVLAEGANFQGIDHGNHRWNFREGQDLAFATDPHLVIGRTRHRL